MLVLGSVNPPKKGSDLLIYTEPFAQGPSGLKRIPGHYSDPSDY